MRSLNWLPLVLALVACDERGVLAGDDTDRLPGAGDDTGGGGGGGDGGGGDGSAPVAWHHVVGFVEILPSDEGLDLDGDGDVDNALGFLAEWIPTDGVSEFLASADQQLILQAWGVEDGDNTVAIGALQGADSDDEPADNFEGETYLVQDGVRPTGRAQVSVETTVDTDGVYVVQLPAAPLDLGVIQIPTAAPWVVVAVLTEDGQEGLFGTAVAISDIETLLRQNNLGFLAGQLDRFADVDLDGNGVEDALSLAVGFGAVPCDIQLLPR